MAALKMALSMGVLNGFLAGRPTFLASKSHSAMVLLPTAAAVPAQRRTVRFLTLATVSKPVTEETKKREPRGIMKPRRVSPEMQAFVGESEIPRTEALKKIWAYIKLHNLQDPENKKVIVCDDQLKTIFSGKDRVGFLEIAGLISPHFLK